MAIKKRGKKRVVKKRASKKTVKKTKKIKRSAGKKKPAKRAVKKAKLAQGPEVNLQKIGEVTHYFPHVNAAAVLMLKDGLKVGDKIYLKGHTTDFKENVTSIQLDHAPIQEAKKAQEIGLQVKSRVRIGDSVYKL